MLELAPITIRQARTFVAEHHRHHRQMGGALFAIALLRWIPGSQAGAELVGVAVAGRPVAGGLQDGRSLKAAGFTAAATTRGGAWSRRARVRRPGEHEGPKTRWEVRAGVTSAKAEQGD